jgi:hypothetical protein
VKHEIAANPQFTLLDEQQVAFEVVLRADGHARRADAKEAVIITGGHGSGKGVIAVALLGELAKRGFNISHATESRSFMLTLRDVVGAWAACSGTPRSPLLPSPTGAEPGLWPAPRAVRWTGVPHVR